MLIDVDRPISVAVEFFDKMFGVLHGEACVRTCHARENLQHLICIQLTISRSVKDFEGILEHFYSLVVSFQLLRLNMRLLFLPRPFRGFLSVLVHVQVPHRVTTLIFVLLTRLAALGPFVCGPIGYYDLHIP